MSADEWRAKLDRADGYRLVCHNQSRVAAGWEMPFWRWRREWVGNVRTRIAVHDSPEAK